MNLHRFESIAGHFEGVNFSGQETGSVILLNCLAGWTAEFSSILEVARHGYNFSNDVRCCSCEVDGVLYVHRMGQWTTCQSGQQVLDRNLRHALASLFGGAAQVGRDCYVVESKQRMIARQRFRVGHVESGCVDVAAGQSRRSTHPYRPSARVRY